MASVICDVTYVQHAASPSVKKSSHIRRMTPEDVNQTSHRGIGVHGEYQAWVSTKHGHSVEHVTRRV